MCASQLIDVHSATSREHALGIWNAGVAAVRGDALVRQQVHVEDSLLRVGTITLPLEQIQRIEVVGAGKGAAAMAEGLESALGESLAASKRLGGWVNVPDDCQRPLQHIHLHGARPSGCNEPTMAAVEGSREILRRVSELGPHDLCLVLLTGGGSALLTVPRDDLTLADQLTVTRLLSGQGASIQQLNTVRHHLSRVKGGGLARACTAGHLVALIISDVLSDALQFIASGPTVHSTTTAVDAFGILHRFASSPEDVPQAIWDCLRRQFGDSPEPWPDSNFTSLLLGNNARAVEAARREAEERGFRTEVLPTIVEEPTAEEVGHSLAQYALERASSTEPICLISGGEPVVRLVPVEQRGRGGRNQQLVLAALEYLRQKTRREDRHQLRKRLALLSGGTDGEDGPTDAAGGVLWPGIWRRLAIRGDAVRDHLRRNDAYPLLEQLGGLVRTGPTHTNVCDIRVIVLGGCDDPLAQ